MVFFAHDKIDRDGKLIDQKARELITPLLEKIIS